MMMITASLVQIASAPAFVTRSSASHKPRKLISSEATRSSSYWVLMLDLTNVIEDPSRLSKRWQSQHDSARRRSLHSPPPTRIMTLFVLVPPLSSSNNLHMCSFLPALPLVNAYLASHTPSCR